MSELVSSFLNVELGKKQKYLFLLVTWNDYVSRVAEELDKQFDPFGAGLGENGTVIRAYKEHEKKGFDELKTKEWPKAIRERFEREQDPFMLVIDRDFAVFNPSEHPWGNNLVFRLYKEPGLVYRLFDSLAQRVRRGDDVLGYIETLENKRLLDKLQSHVEIKPGIFGVSVDVKEILKNITGAA